METFALNATMSLPLSKGGLDCAGQCAREAAHWASWADCLPMVQKRHPQVAGIMLQGLNGGGEMASMNVVRECAAALADAGCVLPSWFELLTALPPPQRAMVRSQGGPLSSRPFVCCPTSRLTKFSSQSFRVLLLRRLHLPLPLSSRNCVHSTALATTGQFARLQGCWGGVGSLWRAIARICREGGARVSRIWISMVVVWRSWQMGCHCLVGSSWPLTPLWFQPCVGTALQGKAQPIVMVLPSGPHTDARKGLTLNLQVQGDVLGWSSLPARLADVGRPRQRISCGLWQLRRLGTFPAFCKPASRLLGSAVGRTSSHVQQRALSLILCWK